MKKNLTKGQVTALKLLRARVNPLDKGFRGTPDVRKAMSEAQLYIDSWIIPLIDFITDGPAWRDQIHGIEADLRAAELQRLQAQEREHLARIAEEERRDAARRIVS